MTDKPRPDNLTIEGARAAVIYLSGIDNRVTISKEIQSLPETWHHGLRDYTYDQVAWGIREYYGKLAVEKRYDVLSPAMCRRILQNHKAIIDGKIEAEQRAIEAAEERSKANPPPPHIKAKLDNLFKRP